MKLNLITTLLLALCLHVCNSSQAPSSLNNPTVPILAAPPAASPPSSPLNPAPAPAPTSSLPPLSLLSLAASSQSRYSLLTAPLRSRLHRRRLPVDDLLSKLHSIISGIKSDFHGAVLAAAHQADSSSSSPASSSPSSPSPSAALQQGREQLSKLLGSLYEDARELHDQQLSLLERHLSEDATRIAAGMLADDLEANAMQAAGVGKGADKQGGADADGRKTSTKSALANLMNRWDLTSGYAGSSVNPAAASPPFAADFLQHFAPQVRTRRAVEQSLAELLTSYPASPAGRLQSLRFLSSTSNKLAADKLRSDDSPSSPPPPVPSVAASTLRAFGRRHFAPLWRRFGRAFPFAEKFAASAGARLFPPRQAAAGGGDGAPAAPRLLRRLLTPKLTPTLSLVSMFRPSGVGNFQSYLSHSLTSLPVPDGIISLFGYVGPVLETFGTTIIAGIHNDGDLGESGSRGPLLRLQPKLHFDVEL